MGCRQIATSGKKQVSVGGHGTLPPLVPSPAERAALGKERSVCGTTHKWDQRERLGGSGSWPQVPFLPPKPCRGPCQGHTSPTLCRWEGCSPAPATAPAWWKEETEPLSCLIEVAGDKGGKNVIT